MDFSAEVEEADAGFGEIQQEFNRQAAELLLAPDEPRRDLEVARAATGAGLPTQDPMGELDRAREELSDRLTRLKDGEDFAPALENFLPVLLPVLKLGLRLAGRPGVVKFLAQLVAPLLRRFTGKFTEPLSKAIVDAGLNLLGLEITPADTAQAARNAVVSTLEDTVRRVAAMPDYVLDNRELLEGAALEAFEQAAAAGFPQVLGEDVYRQRPDLRESAHIRGAWIALPIGGRPRYKKFSRVLRAHITPEKAARIETFDGRTLAEFLEEQMGQPPGGEFEGSVQLYESVPGTLLPEVARMETGAPGLGSSNEASYGQLHPLTPEAAALLIEEPGLGRRMHPASMAGPYAVRPGQRFYHVSATGVRPSLSSRPGRLRRHSHLRVVLNFQTSQNSHPPLPGGKHRAKTASEAATAGPRRSDPRVAAPQPGAQAGIGLAAARARRGAHHPPRRPAAAGDRRRPDAPAHGALGGVAVSSAALDAERSQRLPEGQRAQVGGGGGVASRRRHFPHDVPRSAGAGDSARRLRRTQRRRLGRPVPERRSPDRRHSVGGSPA